MRHVLSLTDIDREGLNLVLEGAARWRSRIDRTMFDRAAPDAIFLYCLPARRGREVTDEVLDGPRSHAFRRLTNFTPTCTALVEWLLETTE